MKQWVKSKVALALGACVFAVLAACARGGSELSVGALIASPDTYQNKRVKVVGFANMAFEDTAIYVSEDAEKSFTTKKAIWLSLEKGENPEGLDKKWVIVEGVFDAHDRGHLELYSGTISKITRLEPAQK